MPIFVKRMWLKTCCKYAKKTTLNVSCETFTSNLRNEFHPLPKKFFHNISTTGIRFFSFIGTRISICAYPIIALNFW